MHLLGELLIFALNIYMWIIIAEVVISWLIVFDVINVKNPKAQNLIALIGKLTAPVMKPIRKYMPPIAGLDLSPLVAIIAIMIVERLIMVVFY